MPVLRLPQLPAAAGKQHWGNLPGAALSLAIAEAASAAKRFTLLLTADSQSAERLEQELSFFAPDLPVLHFPDWETLPYDLFSPHQDIISQRIASLYRLPELVHGVLVVPITTALHRLAPTKFLLGSSLVLDIGQKLDVEQMRTRLEASGYRCVDTVYEHGEFAVRGALIDLFPMGSKLPYRIDLFDDEIETLRTFDPENQRSIDKVESIKLLPAREFPLQKDAVTRFKARFRERFDVDFRRCPIFQDLSSGITPAGIEYYLPLFFDETSTLFDYLPQDTQVFSLPGIEQAAENFWSDVRNRYEERRVDPSRPLLPPAELFLPVEDCFARLKNWPRVVASQEDVDAGSGRTRFPAQNLPNLAIEAKASQPLEALSNFLGDFAGRVLFTAESAGRREVLLELLERLKLRPKTVDSWPDFVAGKERLAITIAPLDEGLLLDDPALALIAESPLFGQRVMQRRRREKRADANNDAVIKNLTELREGAPVVHIDHGVGRYLGLQTLEIDNQAAEFLTMEYAEGAKLYVPVANLHLIARYTGSDDALAPLHRLGSETWQKAKRKAAEQVRDVAAELLDIYARRAAREGYAFADPKADYATFSAGFAFEETPDQQTTIEAVRADMLAPKPMDRLVCGDVGFGKTEVAMRAAFIAVHGGKQVAILVPTTLLAQQHYNSFRDRFADWPVTVEVMSRFKSAKEVNAAVADLAEGKIDIVIGTHKLLSDDVKIKNLGLVIIDEEHRFGVRQKEQLKALRSEVDILTLTATPIPRTLNMAVSGMRDLSIIATPPARRLSVRTFVMEQNNSTVKEALLRELLRGGQVYYLHNDVKTIEKCAADLAALVPEARIAIGHGQMRERDLEQVMSDFYHKRFNVLIASTIIETGIDVPSANTARRQVRPGTTASTARPRRTQSPPGLRLPADATAPANHRRCGKTPGSHRQHPGPGRRLCAGHQRPGNPWRRRTARRRPERADPGRGLHLIYGDARTRGESHPQGRATEPRPTPGRRSGDQPALAGIDPRRLPAGCPRATDPVQAHRLGHRRRRPQGPAGGDDRSLRPVAGTDQEPGAPDPAQIAGRATGDQEGRRRAAGRAHRVRSADAGGPVGADQADPGPAQPVQVRRGYAVQVHGADGTCRRTLQYLGGAV